MFVVVYAFHVHEGKHELFKSAWYEMTELIYRFENSLGSRLHTSEDENVFIAYAQWPDEKTFTDSGKKPPKEAEEIRARMRKACKKVEILHRLNQVDDLLKREPYSPE